MSSDESKDQCEVCVDQMATTIPSGGFDEVHQKCQRCGEFKLTGSAGSVMRNGLGKAKRALLSGWVRNQNRLGSVPMITTENLKKILAAPLPLVMQRANALLEEALLGLDGLGDSFNIDEPRFLAATYSSNNKDVNYLFGILRDQDLADAKKHGGGCEIRPRGYIKLDELKGRGSVSPNGFVAMSFQEDLKYVYTDGFQVDILGAGYEPVLMNRIEHINRIDDEIINQINSAGFVVADFTGHRGGVYFEAGYALGIGLPVFWTCKKNEMADLHFDIRQFNCIAWDTPDELAKCLKVRLEAVLGCGPRSSIA